MYLKTGRFGPYVQLGNPDEEEKPKNASLLKGMTPDQITVETALSLLSLPRELGVHPQTGEKITAYNGRFGPYVKSGEETRSLPADMSPLTVTFEQAIELLAQPKKQRRGFGAPKEPLKVLGTSPVTKQEVKLLEGRYGPYVTDGVTNASLPKQQPIEDDDARTGACTLGRAGRGGAEQSALAERRRPASRLAPRRRRSRPRRKRKRLSEVGVMRRRWEKAGPSRGDFVSVAGGRDSQGQTGGQDAWQDARSPGCAHEMSAARGLTA